MTRRKWWLLAGSVALLAFVASASGIVNDFTYDDRFVVLANPRVHSLAGWWHLFHMSYWPPEAGGDGYRPFTMLVFAIQWVLGNGQPWLFHAVNIALYVVGSVAVFWLASALLPITAAWFAAAIFAVHPVHVEAVANVVGQSELWVGVLFTSAVALYLHRRAAGKLSAGAMLAVCALYCVACFAKEHAVVLPAVLLMAEALVVRDPRPLRARLRELRPFGLGLLLVAVIFFAARSTVATQSGTGFEPFVVFRILDLTYAQRVLTMFGVVPEWVRLFLWPVRLSADYSPPYVSLSQGLELTQLPGLLMLFGVLGLAAASVRRAPAVSFGIAWLCITLLPASNFIVPAGFILAERTLYLPSVGVLIAVAAVLPWVVRSAARWRASEGMRRFALGGIALVILAAGVARSISYTAVWKSNDVLLPHMAEATPLNYRAHMLLGSWYFERGDWRNGEREARLALHLFPYDPYLAYHLADRYRIAGFCEAATPLYEAALEAVPNYARARVWNSSCLLKAGQPAEAKREALRALSDGANVLLVHSIIVRANRAESGAIAAPSSKADSFAKQAGKVRETMQDTVRHHVTKAMPERPKLQ